MRNNVVEIVLLTHKCNDVNCEHALVSYEIKLKEYYAEAKLIRYGLKQNPYKFKIDRGFFLDWLLSLNPTKMTLIGNMRLEDFITLASYIFPDYHARLRSLEEVDEIMHLEDFVKLLHYVPDADAEIQSGWRKLMIKRGPAMFRPHSEFYNPNWFDYRNRKVDSKLIESSTEKIEEFLNTLYEINPEIIRKYIERVDIDEDKDWFYGHIYMHNKLKRCIKEAWWSGEVCLISASNTIRYRLKYDKTCIEKLAEELTKVKT